MKAQGNVGWRAGWLAAWWLSLLLSVLNVIFPLAAQGPSVCWARCSLCGDQRDPQNSQRAEEMTPPDLTQLSRVCWTSMRPLRTRQTGPDGTRLSRVVHHCLSFDKSCYCVAPRFFNSVLCAWFIWALAWGRLYHRLRHTWSQDFQSVIVHILVSWTIKDGVLLITTDIWDWMFGNTNVIKLSVLCCSIEHSSPVGPKDGCKTIVDLSYQYWLPIFHFTHH